MMFWGESTPLLALLIFRVTGGLCLCSGKRIGAWNLKVNLFIGWLSNFEGMWTEFAQFSIGFWILGVELTLPYSLENALDGGEGNGSALIEVCCLFTLWLQTSFGTIGLTVGVGLLSWVSLRFRIARKVCPDTIYSEWLSLEMKLNNDPQLWQIFFWFGNLGLRYGFGAYFTVLPGSEISALMLTYGFPLTIIGMALKVRFCAIHLLSGRNSHRVRIIEQNGVKLASAFGRPRCAKSLGSVM